jgi:dynein assembly factor 1
MAYFNCFHVIIGKKKKDRVDKVHVKQVDQHQKGLMTLRLEQPVKPVEEIEELKLTSVIGEKKSEVGKHNESNTMGHDSPTGQEIAYEGEDEHEDNNSLMKREFSDFDLQAYGENSSDQRSGILDYTFSFETEPLDQSQFVHITETGGETEFDFVQTGHVSDPGVGKAEVWGSPKLKRTCSNLEVRNVLRNVAGQLPHSKSQSFEDLSEMVTENGVRLGSPVSLASRCSADKVMLKKRSSSQILPSKSRRLWWKLFLWSHRNLHKPSTVHVQLQKLPEAHSNQQGGYCSDILERNQTNKARKMGSPESYPGESFKIESPTSFNEESPKKGVDSSKQNWNGFSGGVSGLWPQNQWVAFPTESNSFARVNEWVRDLETQTLAPICDDDAGNGDSVPPSPETERNASHVTRHSDVHHMEAVIHANSVIQSLNSSSTVAHISGIGLNAVPMISGFSSLRAINLSNNLIAHITAGSLPKGLHALNLSRNKISTIEGLRELTHLRVLDLSYNRIFRIGQGLSSCTLIKELYLAGNKISDAEGLHRLSKLTVLDLSFNKITTTKALGQLVANYNSLLALNILGNPIQSNISEDQLRKAVCSLLPKLTYLNKQAIKPQRAREVLTDNVARAALGNSSRDLRRKAVRRVVSQGGSTSGSNHRGSVVHKSRDRSKSRTRLGVLKTLSSDHASSSRQPLVVK